MKSLASNLLLLAASSLAGLLAAELAVRIFFRAEVDAALIAERNARTNFGAFTQPSEIPELSYELRPGARVAWNGLPVAISERGPYRISEAGEAPLPSEALRVAVIGDSTPFGWGVPFAASYPEIWRRALEEKLGRPVAMRNFSVPGYNSEQERIVFERWALPWRPHLVLLHYDHNDWEPAIGDKPATYLEPGYGDNPLRSALVKLVARRLRIAAEVARRERLTALEHRVHVNYAYSGPLYEVHFEHLRGIAESASDQRIPVLCVVFDTFLFRAAEPLESGHYRLLHRRLLATLSGLGFHVLELFHPYQKLMAEQGWRDLSALWLAPDDGHPNEVGHGLIAEALTRYVFGNAALRELLDEHFEDAAGQDAALRGADELSARGPDLEGPPAGGQ